MKLLGLTCGSEGGNSEILLKEALKAGEAAGLEVELIRLHDLDVPIMSGSISLAAFGEGREQGDGEFIWNALMDCDAMIVAAPAYSLGPPGQLKVLADSLLGPNADMTAVRESKKLREQGLPIPEIKNDERLEKPRVSGFISVGGAPTPDWASLAIPTLHTIFLPLAMTNIDQFHILSAGGQHTMAGNEEALTRANTLGQRVASQIGKSFEEAEYLGDPGVCPVCNTSMIVFRDDALECAVCGSRGTYSEKDGKPGVSFSKEEQEMSILTVGGKTKHTHDLFQVAIEQGPQAEENREKAMAYKDLFPAKKPR